MDRKAMQQLKLDRRLVRRRGWIKGDDLERALAELPDVSHKVAPPSEDEESESGEAAQPPSEE